MANATAFAHTNIALIKYWGKRDGIRAGLNLPAVGSLSMTLDKFGTETTVTLLDAATNDALPSISARIQIDGTPADEKEAARVAAFVDSIRQMSPDSRREQAYQVVSYNHVPKAAGLASSASAFAALALASVSAFGVSLSPTELANLARMGSGSAARSIAGGFVRLDAGLLDDGSDCVTSSVAVHPSLDLHLVVAQVQSGPKEIGSTTAMQHTRNTSPFYDAWVDTHLADLDRATQALQNGDFTVLGETMEYNTLKMHATLLTAQPGSWYWTPTTLALMNAVRQLRKTGVAAYFTMDAGPHVKVLCHSVDAPHIVQALRAVEGVRSVDAVGVGGPAALRATLR